MLSGMRNLEVPFAVVQALVSYISNMDAGIHCLADIKILYIKMVNCRNLTLTHAMPPLILEPPNFSLEVDRQVDT